MISEIQRPVQFAASLTPPVKKFAQPNPLPARLFRTLTTIHRPLTTDFTCALSKASSRRVEKTRRLLPFAYASWAKGRRLAEMEIPRAKGGR